MSAEIVQFGGVNLQSCAVDHPVAACTGERVWAFSRAFLKLALLGGRVDFPPVGGVMDVLGGIILSECETCGELWPRIEGCERSLRSIEEKLDRLLELQLGAERKPEWAEQSEERLLAAVREITGEVGALAAADCELRDEAERLREGIGELAEGADRFLAGLQGKLGKLDVVLFLELIGTVEGGGNRRVKTYEEIGARMGVTRQAVQKQYKKVCARFPEVRLFVEAIRRPGKARNFSELSPSDRRKMGVEESYNYDASG